MNQSLASPDFQSHCSCCSNFPYKAILVGNGFEWFINFHQNQTNGAWRFIHRTNRILVNQHVYQL